MPFINTNFDELEKHLKQLIPNMVKSEELKKAGQQSFHIMYKNVMNRLKATDYDYDQSGDFMRLMQSEGKGIGDGNPKIGRSNIQVGFGGYNEGYSGELNSKLYMRKEQSFTIRKHSGYFSFDTKAETQMPKWILMEFGRSGTRNSADKVPKQFQVAYSRDSSKNMMVGPSGTMKWYTKTANKKMDKARSEGRPITDEDTGLLRHYGNSGAKKDTYAMFTPEGASHMYGSGMPHPGIKAGRFFRQGLQDSKIPIKHAFEEGMKSYLARISTK